MMGVFEHENRGLFMGIKKISKDYPILLVGLDSYAVTQSITKLGTDDHLAYEPIGKDPASSP